MNVVPRPKLTLPQLTRALGIEIERCERIRRECSTNPVVTRLIDPELAAAKAALKGGNEVEIESNLAVMKGWRS